MNTFLRPTLYVLLITSLLGGLILSPLGCKPADPVTPPGPTSTTTVSTTSVSSTVVSSTGVSSTTVSATVNPYPLKPDYSLPLPSENRLVRVIFKEKMGEHSAYIPVIDAEEVAIGGGKMMKVSLRHTIEYRYDERGRLVREILAGVERDSIIMTYAYQTNLIYKMRRASTLTAPPYISYDTLTLNDRGLAIVQEEKQKVTFDAADFAVKYLSRSNAQMLETIVRNNLVRSWRQIGGTFGNAVYRSTYDSTLRNLQPDPYPFQGRRSQNLLTKRVLAFENSGAYPNTDCYVYTYYYLFDRYGRVAKLIRPDQAINGYSLIDVGEGVYYYEYSVP
jgi:YD repeat-containing protein